jgi:NTP pyrophosphatase (non-canonical NTP hydrolase)
MQAKTLAMIKMEKNFVAVLEKGYARKPYENFNMDFFKKRLQEEVDELKDALKEGNQDHILSELADVSNIIDFMYELAISRSGLIF